MTTCIACESAEQPEKHEKYLPATTHSAAECSAAFEWLRAEATRDGASPHAGVALDEWHALTVAPTVSEAIAEAVAREREACAKVRDTVMTDTVLAAPLE